jgi:RNA polymerase sigma-70 factor (ECF subfamily)
MEEHLENRDLRELRRRYPEAVERWFKAYANPLYTFIFYRVGKDAELAAEVVQDTFLEAIGRIEEYDAQRGSMYAWLTVLSRNHISRALRARGRECRYKELLDGADAGLRSAFEKIATEPLPDEVIERQETAQLVQMAIANMPTNYAEALKAYYYHKKSIREISDSMGVSEGAVKTLLHRARKAFAEAFVRLDKPVDGHSEINGGLSL